MAGVWVTEYHSPSRLGLGVSFVLVDSCLYDLERSVELGDGGARAVYYEQGQVLDTYTQRTIFSISTRLSDFCQFYCARRYPA